MSPHLSSSFLLFNLGILIEASKFRAKSFAHGNINARQFWHNLWKEIKAPATMHAITSGIEIIVCVVVWCCLGLRILGMYSLLDLYLYER